MEKKKQIPVTEPGVFYIGMVLDFIFLNSECKYNDMAADFDNRCKTCQVLRYAPHRVEKRTLRKVKEGRTTVGRMHEWAKNAREVPKEAIPIMIDMALAVIESAENAKTKSQLRNELKRIIQNAAITEYGLGENRLKVLGLAA